MRQSTWGAADHVAGSGQHRVLLCRDGCARVVSRGHQLAIPLSPILDASPECLEDLLDQGVEIATETTLNDILTCMASWQPYLRRNGFRIPVHDPLPAPSPSCDGLLLRDGRLSIVGPHGLSRTAGVDIVDLLALPVSGGTSPGMPLPTLRTLLFALEEIEKVGV